MRDERAAIRVPHKDDRAANARQASLNGGDIGRERVKAVLRGHHFVALCQQRWNQFAEA
jgi:hypothetical protein